MGLNLQEVRLCLTSLNLAFFKGSVSKSRISVLIFFDFAPDGAQFSIK
jgi:hypothetical protein